MDTCTPLTLCPEARNRAGVLPPSAPLAFRKQETRGVETHPDQGAFYTVPRCWVIIDSTRALLMSIRDNQAYTPDSIRSAST